MNDNSLSAKIESFYSSLEKRTNLSRDEITYRSLQLLSWHIGKAVEGDKVGVLKKEDGKSYLYKPALDILEEIYQQVNQQQ